MHALRAPQVYSTASLTLAGLLMLTPMCALRTPMCLTDTPKCQLVFAPHGPD